MLEYMCVWCMLSPGRAHSMTLILLTWTTIKCWFVVWELLYPCVGSERVVWPRPCNIHKLNKGLQNSTLIPLLHTREVIFYWFYGKIEVFYLTTLLRSHSGFGRWMKYDFRAVVGRFCRESRSTRWKTCPKATLITTNAIWIGLGSIFDLQCERSMTNRLSYDMAVEERVQ